VQSELRKSGFEDLIPAGIVLTGGSSKMEGVTDLAEEIFHLPVRIGVPKFVTGLSDVVRNPMYSTGVGLLAFGARNRDSGLSPALTQDSGMTALWGRMKNWFKGNF